MSDLLIGLPVKLLLVASPAGVARICANLFNKLKGRAFYGPVARLRKCMLTASLYL